MRRKKKQKFEQDWLFGCIVTHCLVPLRATFLALDDCCFTGNMSLFRQHYKPIIMASTAVGGLAALWYQKFANEVRTDIGTSVDFLYVWSV